MHALSSRQRRLRSLRERLTTLIPRGAILLSALTFASYVMGLVRDRVFARTYGASGDLDAYNAALVLPELILAILVVAGLSSAFVPVYSRIHHDDPTATQGFARTVLTVSVLLMAATAGVLFVIAPLTVSFVAPGFDAAQQQLYTELFRVTCVTVIIFAASFALGEMLVVRQRFLGYGLAPLLYNTGIVIGVVVLGPSLGIMGAAIGTVLGACLHLGVRVLDIVRTDFRYRPAWHIQSAGFREYVRLSIPKALAAPVEPLTFLFFTSVASTLVVGGISAISFARNFQSVPVSLVGIAFAVAAFPVMAKAASDGDPARFRRVVLSNLVTIAVLTTGAAVGLVVVGGFAIDLFLGGEAFDADDVALTTQLLAVFALAVPFEATSHLLSRAVYSTLNTVLPVAAALIGLGVTVATVLLLVPGIGIVALPLGFVTGQATEVVLLLAAFLIRVRTVGAEVRGRDADHLVRRG